LTATNFKVADYPAVGNSAALRRMLGIAGVVAPNDATVLINVETGTDKELVARSIHWRSRRSAHPL
jgi:transcriptional regulator with GAF, ATPase, and Fis domain